MMYKVCRPSIGASNTLTKSPRKVTHQPATAITSARASPVPDTKHRRKYYFPPSQREQPSPGYVALALKTARRRTDRPAAGRSGTRKRTGPASVGKEFFTGEPR